MKTMPIEEMTISAADVRAGDTVLDIIGDDQVAMRDAVLIDNDECRIIVTERGGYFTFSPPTCPVTIRRDVNKLKDYEDSQLEAELERRRHERDLLRVERLRASLQQALHEATELELSHFEFSGGDHICSELMEWIEQTRRVTTRLREEMA